MGIDKAIQEENIEMLKEIVSDGNITIGEKGTFLNDKFLVFQTDFYEGGALTYIENIRSKNFKIFKGKKQHTNWIPQKGLIEKGKREGEKITEVIEFNRVYQEAKEYFWDNE